MLEIIKVEESQMNDKFDPNRSNDGGGYNQPLFVIDFNNELRAFFEDTSCGVFGERFEFEIRKEDRTLVNVRWGPMLSESEMHWLGSFSDEEEDELQLYDATLLVEERLGYWIPKRASELC